MSVFRYTGRNESGHRVRGHLDADTPKAARMALSERGILAESVEAAQRPPSPTAARRAALYGELGLLLKSGFTLDKALTLLIDGGDGDPFLLAVRSSIRSGLSLSEALAVACRELPQYERATLRASEEAGFQGGMLVSLGEFLESRQKVADKIRSSLAYPCLVLALAMCMLSLMLYVVLPRATEMFSRMGSTMPRSATLLAIWGPRCMTIFIALAAAIAAFALYARSRSRTDRAFAARIDGVVASCPLLGNAMRHLWAQRFAGTMALLVEAGSTPQEALPVSGVATGSALVSSLADAAAREVRGGLPLSGAIASITPIGPILAEWVKVGESSGALSLTLASAAEKNRQTFENALSRFLSFLEPALIVALGSVVLAVALSILHPVLELAGAAIE